MCAVLSVLDLLLKETTVQCLSSILGNFQQSQHIILHLEKPLMDLIKLHNNVSSLAHQVPQICEVD